MRAFPALLAFLLTAGAIWFEREPALAADGSGLSVGSESQPLRTKDGFALPQAGHRFEFPRDHGSHPEFKIEWWYVTGHLYTEANRRFGFQATFFRRAGPLDNAGTEPVSPSPWFRDDQIYLAHMAVLDVRSGRFRFQERLNRAGWNARAATNTLSVENGDWSLEWADPKTNRMELRGGIRGQAAFSLNLEPRKPLMVFGENGLSRKAAEPSAASYYLTFPRLGVEGSLRWGKESWPVRGQAWMDHEISSSQLGSDQVGWDWACLQFEDGREIMTYRMRRQDGSTDPFSTLAWVGRDGRVTQVGPSRFTWRNEANWKSPETGAVYPFPVRLETVDPETERPVQFRLVPLAPNQELNGGVGGIAYWEGACRVLDPSGREIGSAFLELTGYAGDLTDRFR